VAPPKPSPLNAGEGIKGRSKERSIFMVRGAPKGHECLIEKSPIIPLMMGFATVDAQ